MNCELCGKPLKPDAPKKMKTHAACRMVKRTGRAMLVGEDLCDECGRLTEVALVAITYKRQCYSCATIPTAIKLHADRRAYLRQYDEEYDE